MTPLNIAPTKIICVGRNYADHAKELGNAVPTQPLLFMKPTTALSSHEDSIALNTLTQKGTLGELHFECELSVQIGTLLSKASPEQAAAAVSGVTLGLDLTLRDVQNTLKQKGHPWERAKAFDGSCVLGSWLPTEAVEDYANAHYSLRINQETRQQGNTDLMLFPVFELLSEISQQFTLNPGDVVMTGTPKGVGALHVGDQIDMVLSTATSEHLWQTQVV